MGLFIPYSTCADAGGTRVHHGQSAATILANVLSHISHRMLYLNRAALPITMQACIYKIECCALQ